MNKRGFIRYIAHKNRVPIASAEESYRMVSEGIVDVVAAGITLSLMGFGVFRLQEHGGHSVQFKEKEPSFVKSYKVFKFSAANVLNAAIRKGYHGDDGCREFVSDSGLKGDGP